MIRILAVPGSLRPDSSSNLVLREMISWAPPQVVLEVYDGIGALPHFNDAERTPASVAEFREKVRNADAVVICTPEYAFGIPGSLKNALDWTAGSGEFNDKPVSLITASSHGEKGHAAMLLVLTAISARIIVDASVVISFVRSRLDSAGKISDASLIRDLKRVVRNIAAAAEQKFNVH